MQNASDDSDDPSSSESLAESQRVTRSKVPRTQHQLSVDKPGTYPKPEQEIQRVQEAIQLVEETQAEMEPEPRPILNAWATPTTVTKVPRLGKSLQIPSTISKKSNEDHDTQFEKWCDDMLEQTGPEHNPPQETTPITVDSSDHLENLSP